MRGKIIFLSIITYMCSIKAQDSNSKTVKLEALVPRGIRVTMRDDDYSLFEFIGTLRRGAETKLLQSYYMPRAKNGLWIFTDRNYELRLGDNINYTIYFVKHDSNHELKGIWHVSEFVNDEEMLTCEISETNTLCSKKFVRALSSSAKSSMILSNWSGIRRRCFHRGLCTGEPNTRECKQTSSGYQILPPVVSGKITTRNLFSFKYGRIDVRAKLPAGDWLIPGTILSSATQNIFKSIWNLSLTSMVDDHELYGGPIACEKEPCTSTFLKKFKKQSGQWNKHFHIFTLIWKPDGFQVLVDDEDYGDIKPYYGMAKDIFNIEDIPHVAVWQRGTPMTPFDQLFYISLGVRVGGINDFADTPEKPWMNNNTKAMFKFWKNSYFWKKSWVSPELIVDYVRVYSL
ncbi:unnamed protein product [Euphydryas editha]|uniref:Uncharacterized protein n=1 Tax=Euphydryas editha TaxID=104508 RepID=A0AAU9TZ48_EUPED|nr:unnamed protein product [Euphydryas editha]